jgi:hypothetical protein
MLNRNEKKKPMAGELQNSYYDTDLMASPHWSRAVIKIYSIIEKSTLSTTMQINANNDITCSSIKRYNISTK